MTRPVLVYSSDVWLLELVKHATENKDIGSWDISSKMKEMNETFNEHYILLKSKAEVLAKLHDSLWYHVHLN